MNLYRDEIKWISASIVYSRIQYGILTMGTASNLCLQKVEICLNRI